MQSTYKQEEIDRQVEKMLEAGVITTSQAPYYSQVHLVPKPNGKWRFTIDFRNLNDCCEQGGWPQPSCYSASGPRSHGCFVNLTWLIVTTSFPCTKTHGMRQRSSQRTAYIDSSALWWVSAAQDPTSRLEWVLKCWLDCYTLYANHILMTFCCMRNPKLNCYKI